MLLAISSILVHIKVFLEFDWFVGNCFELAELKRKV